MTITDLSPDRPAVVTTGHNFSMANSVGQQINALAKKKWLLIEAELPSGSLEARKLSNGCVQFYWRYTFEKKTHREVIGLYDSGAPPKSREPTELGYSVAAARKAAGDLASIHVAHKDSGGFGALKRERVAKRTAEKASAEQLRKYTLRRLLTLYCEHLTAQGRGSGKNARSIFTVHLFRPFPEVADMPARDVSDETLTDVIRQAEGRAERTSGKLRSFLKAAYNLACSARLNASVPAVFKEFQVKINPLDRIPVGSGASKSAKDPLSSKEMQTYWRIIEKIPGFRGHVLRFHLLTGAQRPAQLMRLLVRDIKDGAVMLYDGKGRPGHKRPARPWQIPLTPRASSELAACKSRDGFAFPSSRRRGKATIGPTISTWAKEEVGNQIAHFETKRLRSGVETLLARKGVRREVRGYLQSHGISGVQAVNYNAYEYLPEKLAALKTLEDVLVAPEPSPDSGA
jgi:hypothetical protein